MGIIDKAKEVVVKGAAAVKAAVAEANASDEAMAMETPREKPKPVVYRNLPIEPTPELIEQVLKHNPAKSPQQLVRMLMARRGYMGGVADFDRLERRVARFKRSQAKSPRKRMPSHIRDAAILVDVINRAVAQAFAPKPQGEGA